jgi:hypothetical protein
LGNNDARVAIGVELVDISGKLDEILRRQVSARPFLWGDRLDFEVELREFSVASKSLLVSEGTTPPDA